MSGRVINTQADTQPGGRCQAVQGKPAQLAAHQGGDTRLTDTQSPCRLDLGPALRLNAIYIRAGFIVAERPFALASIQRRVFS